MTVTRTASPRPTGAAQLVPPAATLSAAPTSPGAPGPVPASFLVSAASFVSPTVGFVLGTVPCGAARCQQVARTTDGGLQWVGLPTPQIPRPYTSNTVGISDIAFETPAVGFLYGPALFTTSDGGVHWTQPDGPGYVPGDRVLSLAVTPAGAYALVRNRPNATDLEFASTGAHPFALAASDLDEFTDVVPFGRSISSASADALLPADPTLVLTSNATTHTIRQLLSLGGDASCTTLPTASAELVLSCSELGHDQEPSVRAAFTSTDGGRTWRRVNDLPVGVASGLLAKGGANAGDDIVLALDDQATAGLVTSHDGGRSWRTTKTLRAWGSDTFSSVAFVGPHTVVGVYGFEAAGGGPPAGGLPAGGLPAGGLPPSVGSVVRSDDGGTTWRFIAVRSGP